MKNFVNERLALFIRATFAGGFAGGIFMFGTASIGTTIILAFALKLFGTIVIAFTSGISTVAAADLYVHKLKPALFKLFKIKEKPKN